MNLQDRIKSFESDPVPFEELVASFLLDENITEGDELHDLLKASPVLRKKFEEINKIHVGLANAIGIKSKPRARSAALRIMIPVSGIAAAILIGLFIYLTRMLPMHKMERHDILTFGTCIVNQDANLRSEKLSVCDYFFHTASKGKSLRLRLLPNSEAQVSLVEGTWIIKYEKGSLLIESYSNETFFAGFAKDLEVNLGSKKAILLGTKIRISPGPANDTKLEVLEGEVRLVNSESRTSQIDGQLLKSETSTFITEGEDSMIRPLSTEEKTILARVFSGMESNDDGKSSEPDPGKILFPEAIPVPGNRILLKDGRVKKGKGLLQNKDVYILIMENRIEEIKAAEIRRIEFE
ncbi:hypothetical protein LEP1GSC058_4006 [Leptospira fainei serovar Hurstbridge str. BUT 6]|uniref:Sigma factor regulatory protein, FecR/PupR family n=1 Tax=Leptospira fainei serovar Hurstbridge str. BUT 6 TaxID=1193011 RepID=S3UX96_9LEPT|nr:hypothetical protein [Leptospira fainei]EPG72974.1 hypothetical protein LEP1GSC058_4006 [Leptospira fainei serovar Hurstbridge str. BUT 6]